MEFISALGTVYILILIGMGITQPIAAILRLLVERRKSSAFAIGLKRYLFSVCLYFTLLFLFNHSNIYKHEAFYLIYLLIVPVFFAIWYIRHIYKWNQKRKNIKAYDKLQVQNAPHVDRLLLDSYPKKKVRMSYPISRNPNAEFKSKETIIRYLPPLRPIKITR